MAYPQLTRLVEIFVHQYERYLPTAFDESMTILQKLNKVIEFMNQTGILVNSAVDLIETAIQAQDLDIANLQIEVADFTAFITSQQTNFETSITTQQTDFENSITNDLLPQNIETVLDDWYAIGKLAEIINTHVLDMKATKGEIVSSDLSIATDAGKIQLINLSEEVQSAMAGTSPVLSSVADNSITTTKYANESITSLKLAKSYRNRPNIVSGVDIATAIKDGIYLVLAGATGLPSDFVANLSGILKVDSISDRWVIQTLYELNNSKKRWVRIYDTTGNPPIFIKDFTLDVGSITGINIADSAIERKHLTDNYNYKGIIPFADVNSTYKTGSYLITEVSPYANSSSILVVTQSSSRFVVQQLFPLSSSIYPSFYRVIDTTVSSTNHPAFRPVSDDYKGILSTTDLNTVIESGTYLVTGGANTPSNTTQGTLVVKKLNSAWVSQVLYPLSSQGNKMPSYRTWRDPIEQPPAWNEYISNASLTSLSLKDKIVVNFGDSIFGNKRPPNDVSTAIAIKTGATVHNLGFGGCQMSEHRTWWDAFSMYRIADAVSSGDFTLQETALSEGISPPPETYADRLPSYFTESVNLMKSIDFSTVDYITIGYGTNDWTDGVSLDGVDKKDITTFKGALRYSLEKLMTTYPNLKVLLLTPTYRFWLDATTLEFVEDSDVKLINGVNIVPFVDAIKDVAIEYKVPSVDNYFDLGINKFNRSQYFSGVDGTHHNVEGGKFLGNKIASQLISRF